MIYMLSVQLQRLNEAIGSLENHRNQSFLGKISYVHLFNSYFKQAVWAGSNKHLLIANNLSFFVC